MAGDNIPKTEPVSETEPVSTEVTDQQKEPEKEPQPLTDEQKAQISQAVTEQMGLARRQFQSDKDKAVLEVRREAETRARLAESRASAYDNAFQGADEDVRRLAEEAKLKGDTEYYRQYHDQSERERNVAQYRDNLMQSLRDEVAVLGLDPEDKAIDYAQDATDYFSGRKRFSESVSKALKTKDTNRDKEMTDKWNQMEADFRKKHNLDSQDTTTGAGVVNESDADFMAAFGAGDLPLSKENKARYEEIKKKHY